MKRPFVLTIGGFDPSGGAGVLADIKTFENIKTYGVSVCTANTIQNDKYIADCQWMSLESIQAQIHILFDTYPISYVKIGIVQNINMFIGIIEYLRNLQNKLYIIWDPVVQSSSRFIFNKGFKQIPLEVLKQIDLICPNTEEIEHISSYTQYLISPEENAQNLAEYVYVFLKGGHSKHKKGYDYLFANGNIYPFKPKGTHLHPKHGTGCILSSAILSYLSKGYPIVKSCLKAKQYVHRYMESSNTLLGYHKR